MRTLGIDPSLSCTGWAVIEDGKVINSGTIKTDAKQTFLQRLEYINSQVSDVIDRAYIELDVTTIAIEDVFVNRKNLQVVIKLAKVQGIIIGAVSKYILPDMIHIYSPAFVKQTITNNGNATKEQVLRMVKIQSGYKGKQLDESDAIAVALTCERDMT